MKFTALLALFATASAVQLDSLPGSETPCISTAAPLNVDEATLNAQLEYFSRSFDKRHYNNAMIIYGELKKRGLDPKVRVNTYEIYDKSFGFERVRRYDLVQQHMNLIEHF